MQKQIIVVENLSKRFKNIVANNDISLSVKKGEFFFILGPSGCGKTTFLKILSGIVQPDSGSIYLKNTYLNNVPPHKRDINTVFQNYALFPHMTVFENISFGLKMKGLFKQKITNKVEKALLIVKLKSLENRMTYQLSSGQQQRVALARCLINEPSVLLLDEPLGALDAKLRKQMQLELKHLQKNLRMTFICVTHDQEEALTMADRIAVMNEGRIEQIGTPDEIYNRPRTRFVADFIGDNNFFENINCNFDKGFIKIKINNQVIRGIAPGDSYKNEKIAITIRPEKIKILSYKTKKTKHINYVQGNISEIIYKGNLTQYLVAITPEITLKVIKQNCSAKDNYDVGQKVYLEWLVEDTIAVEDI